MHSVMDELFRATTTSSAKKFKTFANFSFLKGRMEVDRRTLLLSGRRIMKATTKMVVRGRTVMSSILLL